MSTTSNQKKVLSVVVGVAALLIVAVGTVLLLTKLNVTQSNDNDKKAMSQVAPVDVIQGLRTTVPAALTHFTPQVAIKGQFQITAKLSNKQFAVSFPVDEAIVFTAKDKKATDAAAVLSDSKKYFEDKGLVETASSSAGASYENQVALCQVQVQAGEAGAVIYGCSAHDAVQKEYDAVAQLTQLYNQANPGQTIAESSFSSVGRITRQKDSVEGAVLSLTSNNAGTSNGKTLLFGAVSGKWEYVADLSTGKSSGKANVPDNAVALIKDPKWNGVLAGLVGLE